MKLMLAAMPDPYEDLEELEPRRESKHKQPDWGELEREPIGWSTEEGGWVDGRDMTDDEEEESLNALLRMI